MPEEPEYDPKQIVLSEKWIHWLVVHGCAYGVAKTAIYGMLAGVARKKTPPRLSPMLQAQVIPILQQYRALYFKKYAEEPIVQPQEHVNIVKLLKEYGPPLVTARLNAFFDWDDAWVEKVGYTLGVFYKQWNKLAVIAAKRPASIVPPECRHEPRCLDRATHSRRFLDDVKKSSSTETP